MMEILDGDFVSEIVKVFQFLDLLACLACIITYLPFVIHEVRRHPAESRFMGWSVLVAIVLLPSYASLVYSYVRTNIHPAPAAGLSQGLQLFTLVGLYFTLLGRWAEAEYSRFTVRFILGLFVSIIVASIVAVLFPITA
jgi:hypothetical protein